MQQQVRLSLPLPSHLSPNTVSPDGSSRKYATSYASCYRIFRIIHAARPPHSFLPLEDVLLFAPSCYSLAAFLLVYRHVPPITVSAETMRDVSLLPYCPRSVR